MTGMAVVSVILIGGTPLAEMATRTGLMLAAALARRGHRVTACLCSSPDRAIGAATTALAKTVAADAGFDLAQPTDSITLDGDPGGILAERLNDWLKASPAHHVVLPDLWGIGFYALQDRALGRAHLATRFHLLLTGPSRQLMLERAQYPRRIDLSSFHREAAVLARVDTILAPSTHQSADLPTKAPIVPLGPLFADPEFGLPRFFAEAANDEVATGAIACLTHRHMPDEVELFSRALARTLAHSDSSRIELPVNVRFLHWGGPHDPAQMAPAFRHLTSRHVTFTFGPFTRSALAGCRLAVVPAFGFDALPLLHLCQGLAVPTLAQDNPALAEAATRRECLFTNDYKSLAARLDWALVQGLTATPPAIDAGARRALESFLALPATDSRIAAPAIVSGAPLVTVVLTLYDRWQHLPTALESLARQSWPHLEILVSDDGSDDAGALAYLDRLDNETRYGRLSVVRQPHHSLGRNRNTAAARSAGDYILFMDDDNIAKPHEVEAFIAAAQKSGADALSCFSDLFHDEAEVIRGAAPVARRLFLGGAIEAGVASNVLGDANSFFPRETFERFGIMVEPPQLGFEDWEILTRIALAGGRVEVIPEALYWYREAPGAMRLTTRQLANNLIPLRTQMNHAGPFADILWQHKGAYIQDMWGVGSDPL